MDKSKIKLLAFDLDGTLSQHKTPLDDETRDILSELSNRYKLLMSGAGMCRRIFNQMRQFPIDILGNYGMQYACYNYQLGDIEIVRDMFDDKFIRIWTMYLYSCAACFNTGVIDFDAKHAPNMKVATEINVKKFKKLFGKTCNQQI